MAPEGAFGRAVVEPLEVRSDARGRTFDPVPPVERARYRSIHVVLNEPGAVRGNRYHRHASEVLVFAGPAVVRLREGGELRDVALPDSQLVRFGIPPGVSHAVRNTGGRPSTLVVLGTSAPDAERPDVIHDVLFE